RRRRAGVRRRCRAVRRRAAGDVGPLGRAGWLTHRRRRARRRHHRGRPASGARTGGHSMRRRLTAVVAWGTWCLSMSAILSPFVYRIAIGPAPGFEDQPGSLAPTVAVLLFITSFATVGALIAWKRPANPIGWLLSAAGLCYALGAFGIL